MYRKRAPHLAYPIPALLLTALAGLLWVIYGIALPGRFLYDDPFSLGTLTTVHDWRSAANFVFSGSVGALGRPVSSATLPSRPILGQTMQPDCFG